MNIGCAWIEENDQIQTLICLNQFKFELKETEKTHETFSKVKWNSLQNSFLLTFGYHICGES